MADLHPRTHLRAAAWVPDDDPHRDWADAVELAAEWIWQQSENEGAAPRLVTNTNRTGGFGIEALDEIVRAGRHTTPQSRSKPDPGPTLVFVPYEPSLKCAMDLARGFSLAAVETKQFSLAEWAAGADAVNLLTNEVSASAIHDDARNDLDSAMLYGGRNGWTGSDEKAHARRFLLDHVRAGRLTPDQAASYVMSQGASDRGAKRLRELLQDNASRRR